MRRTRYSLGLKSHNDNTRPVIVGVSVKTLVATRYQNSFLPLVVEDQKQSREQKPPKTLTTMPKSKRDRPGIPYRLLQTQIFEIVYDCLELILGLMNMSLIWMISSPQLLLSSATEMIGLVNICYCLSDWFGGFWVQLHYPRQKGREGNTRKLWWIRSNKLPKITIQYMSSLLRTCAI